MSRKKSSEKNKFAALLEDLVRGSSASDDDADLIDAEAEDVEDYAALPPAKARMLPPGAAPPKRGRNRSITPPTETTETPPEALPESLPEITVPEPAVAEVESVIEPPIETSIEIALETSIEVPIETFAETAIAVKAETPEKPPIEQIKPRPWGKSRLEVAPVYDEDGNRKKGRPAKGKRSDGDWAGRTYYVRYTTDTKLEKALWKLRREGLDVDKSDLTDALLNAWAQVELGEVADSGFGTLIDRVIDQAIDRD